jgi:hypothetical protein
MKDGMRKRTERIGRGPLHVLRVEKPLGVAHIREGLERQLIDRVLEVLLEEISEESHQVLHGRTKDARIKAEGAMWAFAKVQKWVNRNKE